MNRHIALILGRILGIIPVILALPLAHIMWGMAFSTDGSADVRFLHSFWFIGLGAGVVYWLIGLYIHYKLRNRSTKTLVFAELMLLGVFLGLIIFVGVSAEYTKTAKPLPWH